MNYAKGFADGERQAMKDRRSGIVRMRPANCPTSYDHPDRGFWDGYEPRSATWAHRPFTAARAWWQDREEVTA